MQNSHKVTVAEPTCIKLTGKCVAKNKKHVGFIDDKYRTCTLYILEQYLLLIFIYNVIIIIFFFPQYMYLYQFHNVIHYKIRKRNAKPATVITLHVVA